MEYATVSVLGLGTVGSSLADRLARNGLCVSADVAAADLVIEALPERLDIKAAALRKASAECDRATAFATTTTAFPLSQIATATERPDRTVSWHPVGQVIEVAALPGADPAVVEGIRRLARRAGLIPVDVRNRPGHVSGALLMGYLNNAIRLCEAGYASQADIDTAMQLGCGLPEGPFAQLDRMGLDVAADTLRALGERDPWYLPAPLLTALVAAGRLGRKSGHGFYHYPVSDPPAAPATRKSSVRRVGVLGSGLMATGIAEVCVRAGHPVVLCARTEARATQAATTVSRSLQRAVQRGKATAEAADEALGRLTVTTGLDQFGRCDLVIEAIVEELAVKRAAFAQLDRCCAPGTLLATTTSSLPIIECAAATSRPQDVIGLHFFNPAPVMRLVEISRTVLTSDTALQTATAFCSGLGKQPVGCTDRAGFIVNSLLFPYLNTAVRMLEEHRATPDDVDAIMRDGLGFPLGPLELLDVVGLDVSLLIQRRLFESMRDPALSPAGLLEQLVASGRLGRKTGQGFHSYLRA
jgi:3-hydroxybutyryl-CoA dehydrogenase